MHLWTTSDFLLRKEASRFFRFDGMPLRKSFEGCGERDGRKKWSADFSKIFSAEITLFYPSPIWLILFSLYRFTDKSSTKRTPLSIHTAKVWVKIFHATRFFKSSRITRIIIHSRGCVNQRWKWRFYRFERNRSSYYAIMRKYLRNAVSDRFLPPFPSS